MHDRTSEAVAAEPPVTTPVVVRDDAVPLCVDLDGTLVKTDTLLEAFLAVVKRNPLFLLLVPLWLLGGRARFKRRLAEHARLDAAALPYTDDLLAHLHAERRRGRRLVLTTAADETIARAVAAHVGVFDDVLASDGRVNLKGRRKLAALRERFGARGFDYAGDSAADLAVWREARQAVAVNVSRYVRARAGAGVTFAHSFGGRRGVLRLAVRALRPHQWVKNLLLLLPTLMAHRWADPSAVRACVLAFVAFSGVASSVYVVNDLLDLRADRAHRSKRRRPFASGDLPLAWGLAMVPLLLVASFVVAASLPLYFVAVLACYLALTAGYSTFLKHVALVDVIVLAGLYSSRILAGGTATDTPISPWLLAFSMFFFLGLGYVKRVSEVISVQDGDGRSLEDRGYRRADLGLLEVLGAASGYLAVLVFALYVNSQAVTALYARPIVLWLVCPLMLYWVSRVWLLTHRGEMHDDPIVFAIKDPASYALGAAVVAIVLGAGSR